MIEVNPMRTIRLCLTFIACLALHGQTPESPDLQSARKKPIETWMGRPLLIYEDAASIPIETLRSMPFPFPQDRREARIGADLIAVSLDQIRTFQSGQELAEFLAHATAHARLGHSERMAMLSLASGILAPDRSASTLVARTRAEMEKEAEPVAAEFMATSGCAPGPCQMFGLLLRAARR